MQSAATPSARLQGAVTCRPLGRAHHQRSRDPLHVEAPGAGVAPPSPSSSLAPGLGRRVSASAGNLRWGSALLGTAFSLAFSLGGVWSIVNNVMKLKFFHAAQLDTYLSCSIYELLLDGNLI
ncbi:hypothetical protein HU200_058160 [Digitaria exilis]|uniref:Uncharacterized protein n=1 Tax=Digitaria exilis TaxID=1010633 RepID=A0A835ADV8_9POAL|nr:hypothetical protein HU200_058160 [Digitaria exilis]